MESVVPMSQFNTYKGISKIGYRVIEYLMLNNEPLWKLLKFDTPDALSKPALTLDQKASLIFNGNGDSESFKVFRSPYDDDMFTRQSSQMRVYLTTIYPDNSARGTISISIDLLTHVKLSNIDGYLNRIEVMVEEILQTLNGVDVGGIGRLNFDRKSSFYDIAAQEMWNNRNFYGYRIIMSTKYGRFNNNDCG